MSGILTGLDRRSAMPWPYEGRPRELPLDEEYAFRSDRGNANWRQLMEAIATALITGIMCEEGTVTYGASTTTHCRLTLPDGYAEVNDFLVIGDGTRIWRVEVAVAREIEFSDSNLIDPTGGEGTADYNTIQNNLIMFTLSKSKLSAWISKNEIARGSQDGALHLDDLQRSKTDTDNANTTLEKLFTEHENDGSHSDNIIGNSNLKKADVLITEAFISRVKNGAFNINGAASLDYWTEVGSLVTFQANDNGKAAFPRYCAQLSSDDSGEGMSQDLSENKFEANVPIRMCFYAKGNSGGEKLKFQLYNGIESAEAEVVLTTTYTAYYLTFTPSDATNLTVRFLSNQASAQTIFIALVTIASGDVHTYPERSPQDVQYDMVLQDTFFVEDITVFGDMIFAQWDLLRDIKILQIDIKCLANVDADVVIRLTDGSTNHDTTIASGNSTAQNTADQDYDKNATMQLKVLSSSATTGDGCNVTIQYRTR